MAKANYDLPDEKIRQVIKLSGAKSKKEAIVLALEEYLFKKKREKLAQSHGKIRLNWTLKSLKAHRA